VFVELPGASHLAPFTHATGVATALLDFFASMMP
jgi:hypothetical protein